MQASNIRLIYLRELRDQLRDRRTLFTVLILPLLLYPLLGVSFIRISQFMRAHPTDCWVIGYQDASSLGIDPKYEFPSLLLEDQLNSEFCPDDEAALLQVKRGDVLPEALQRLIDEAIQNPNDETREGMERHLKIQKELAAHQVDLLLYFPPYAPSSDSSTVASARSDEASPTELDPSIPRLYIFGNLARDESSIARSRLLAVLDRWRTRIIDENLAENELPPTASRPFLVQERDLAATAGRQAILWSKILPFIMLIWALTGAFYPAIDSCAGEKERGTLETLLCSPAARSEIVVGKMLNVMTFSAASAMLNLLSMMFSGLFIIQAFQQAGSMLPIGFPPMTSLLWLGVAILPASALFSSLALAVAVFARSTKEGQYYLVPLLLVSLPLMMVAMLPATELELGTALIPLTGLMLLLRELIEGEYMLALKYAAPVMAVTATAVWLSARWGISQFSKETVIFRESEQVGIALWFKHLVRDRETLPGVSEAVFCGVLILLLHSFFSMLLPQPTTWASFATTTAISLIAFVATPALLMAIFLTKSPGRTLMLQWSGFLPLVGAVVLAICLHPTLMWIGNWIVQLYPPSPEFLALQKELESLLLQAPGMWAIVLLIAGTPAICEEIAFRGFVMTGLSGLKNKYAAIALSALMFGAAHGILQQSMTASITGLALGWVAFQSRSLLPAIAYHFTHNSLSVLSAAGAESPVAESFWYLWLFDVTTTQGVTVVNYNLAPTFVLLGIAIALMVAFGRLNRSHSLDPETKAT
jgi:sodium transport system permease protein